MFDFDSIGSVGYFPAYFKWAIGVGRQLSNCGR